MDRCCGQRSQHLIFFFIQTVIKYLPLRSPVSNQSFTIPTPLTSTFHLLTSLVLPSNLFQGPSFRLPALPNPFSPIGPNTRTRPEKRKVAGRQRKRGKEKGERKEEGKGVGWKGAGRNSGAYNLCLHPRRLYNSALTYLALIGSVSSSSFSSFGSC